MPPYVIQSPCTVDDAPGLAKNNVAAFWGNNWWRHLWGDRTLDYLIDAIGMRTPNLLLTDRHIRRHQKVVDSESGEIVGYARWLVPASQEQVWLEAQTPDVSEVDKKRFKEQYDKADFNYRKDMEVLDDHIPEWRTKHKHDVSLVLDYLAVHPNYHRRGIGSMLVRSGVEKAAELGLDVFLIAMGQNACDMYTKAGFVVVEQRRDSLEPYGVNDLYETFCLVKNI